MENIHILQYHLIIRGVVQGVGFRAFVKSWAKELGVTGWVRNTPEGDVEALLQGNNEQLEKMTEFCRKGPFLAEVKNINIENIVVKERYESFEIVA